MKFANLLRLSGTVARRPTSENGEGKKSEGSQETAKVPKARKSKNYGEPRIPKVFKNGPNMVLMSGAGA